MAVIGQESIIVKDGSDKWLRLRSASWLRDYEGSPLLPASWTDFWIGIRLRYGFSTSYAENCTWPAAGQNVGANTFIYAGLCNGAAGSMAATLPNENVTNWLGLRWLAVGGNFVKYVRANPYTEEGWVEAGIFPDQGQNGSWSGASGTTTYLSCKYWGGLIVHFARTSPTQIQIAFNTRSPYDRDVTNAELVDILNSGNDYLTINAFAAGTYGWSTLPGVSLTATVDEATYGNLSHVEVGTNTSVSHLDLGGVLVKGV